MRLFFPCQRRRHRRRAEDNGAGISIIVPAFFRDPCDQRARNWEWLHDYWAAHLPEAQIVVGRDRRTEDDADVPFSKAAAVNDGFTRVTGDVVVIADADCYIAVGSVLECVRRIRQARTEGKHLWYIPYRRFYRLGPLASAWVLRSDPRHPVWPTDPPHGTEIQDVGDRSSSHGHWFGALIQVMPVEAFQAIGGWDERFRDWGGEDVSMMRAVDTVWGRHRTLHAPVFHLWHPSFGSVATVRTWTPDGTPGANDWLSRLYDEAIGDPQRMRNVMNQRWT